MPTLITGSHAALAATGADCRGRRGRHGLSLARNLQYAQTVTPGRSAREIAARLLR